MTDRANGVADGSEVLIVGAGPVGLLIALRLANAGIAVKVVEKNGQLDESPRAVAYFAGALISLQRAGVLHKILEAGYGANGFAWRKPLEDDEKGGKRLGDILATQRFPVKEHKGIPTGMIHLTQAELNKLLFKETSALGVDVVFNNELVAISNHDNHVTATIRNTISSEETTLEPSFLVGADGGKSAVRRNLDISMQGHTWPERLVSINYHYDQTIGEPLYPASCVVREKNFGIITPLEKPIEGKSTLCRATIAVAPDDERTDKELLSETGLISLLERIVPGPRPLKLQSVTGAMYKAHQLCASTFHRGRCILAGDAAHITNPIGAMGLNTGILDSEAAADALELIFNDKGPLHLLSLYGDERRRVFQFFVNPLATANILRLKQPTEHALDDWLLRALNHAPPEFLRKSGEAFFTEWRTDIRKLAMERGLVKSVADAAHTA